jgi:transcriptional regulator of acetoin/glycerol metabolism
VPAYEIEERDIDWNRVDAATALGVDRTTLYRLMKRLSL